MSANDSKSGKVVTCPACNGEGKIDMTIHIVRPGKSETICGKPRPVSDRRRTTNTMRADCRDCLEVAKKEAVEAAANSKG